MPLAPAQDETGDVDLVWVKDLLDDYLVISAIKMGARKHSIEVRGRLKTDAERTYRDLAPRCRARGRTLWLRGEPDDAVAIIAPGIISPSPNSRWLPAVLCVLTVVSVLATYVLLWGEAEPTASAVLRNLYKGIPYGLSLLSILGAHELGHYFVARRLGVAVTLPFFIPFPLSLFGTMGAVIRMKDVPPDRRALLLIGAAGPLAGLAVAIPVIALGLSLSTVGPLPAATGYMMEGNSILYALLKRIVLGEWLPGLGRDVNLHPVALAGWAGLLVTSFNLLPAGSLDGGHIAYSLLGPKSRYLTWAVIGALLLMGIVWQGWLMWAALIFVFSRMQTGPRNDVSRLTSKESALAAAMLVLFVLLFAPVPLRFV